MIRSKLLLKVLAHPSSTLSRADRPPTTLLCDTGGLYTRWRSYRFRPSFSPSCTRKRGLAIGLVQVAHRSRADLPPLSGLLVMLPFGRQHELISTGPYDGLGRRHSPFIRPVPIPDEPGPHGAYGISLLVMSRVLVNAVSRDSAIGWRICGVFCFWRERSQGLVGVVSTDPATPASASVEYLSDYEVPDLKWSAHGPEGEAHQPECLWRPVFCCSLRQIQLHSL